MQNTSKASKPEDYRFQERARKSKYRERRRKGKVDNCACCRKEMPFCWTCRCGFAICQDCMEENFWGMSCNGITWSCPDCGRNNGLGNQ